MGIRFRAVDDGELRFLQLDYPELPRRNELGTLSEERLRSLLARAQRAS
jgi:hypothetical protein